MNLADAACLCGGGVDVQWDALWTHRTIHAQTVHAFLQDNMLDSREWSECTSHPLSSGAEADTLCAWIVVHCPLIIQHGMKVGKTTVMAGSMPTDRVFNLSMGLIQRLLVDTVEHIRKGFGMAKNGVNAFKIDQHWMDPDCRMERSCAFDLQSDHDVS